MVYDPATQQCAPLAFKKQAQLMKRYYMMQKAKDATTFGVLMGTLGVHDYLAVLQAVKALLKAKGRKFYTFTLGKLNVAKLANFAEIDCFIHIACPHNTLVDAKEYYQPIVTPWELLCSLEEEQWTSHPYTLLFHNLLPFLTSASFAQSEKEEVPHFSFLQKRMVYHEPVLDEVEEQTVDEGECDKQVATRHAAHALIQATSLLSLHRPSFQGLTPQYGETKVKKATEGHKGVARRYHAVEQEEDMKK